MTERALVGVVYNTFAVEADEVAQRIVRGLGLDKRSWIATTADVEAARPQMPATRLVITVGGDGTILRTARIAAPHGVPLVGVNMGRLGFMTELSADEAVARLPAYLDGTPTVEERIMLHATVVHKDRRSASAQHPVEFDGLNDVVVGRGAVSRLVRVRTSINGVLLAVYRADGMIVATPTGSTGYALSAGGPVMYPTSRDLELQPVAVHMGLRSGLVIPGDSVVEMMVETDVSAMLSVDGYQELPLQSGDTVRVVRSPHSARFLRSHGTFYFHSTLFHRLGLQQVPQRPSVS